MQEKGNLSINSENFLPIIKKWLYTDQDIFIRELVSNGCDAVTKLQKLSSMGEADLAENEDFQVRVVLDKDAKTLQFVDNGIGMTADEVKKYINQIAFSGATDFLAKYEENADEGNEIIGHFGLGFYSAFMVADKVEIDTLSYQKDAQPAFWRCEGGIDYEMAPGSRTQRGTTITLYLGEDGKPFLEKYTVKKALEKYCAFMPVPIYLDVKETKEETDKAAEPSEVAEKAPILSEEGTEEKDRQIMQKVEEELAKEPINDTQPLWLKKPADCTEEEYKAFYHKVFFDFNDPLFWIHLNMDYPFRLKGILYFPKFVKQTDVAEGEIKLYSNQVYIADNVKEVVPEFLLLLKGVLDCPDMPLNVSRSALQNDGYVEKMNNYITKKVGDKLNQMCKNERETYEAFWDDISMFIEYGCMKEEKLYDKIKDAVLFHTTDGTYETLNEYLEKNKEKHENKVFFVSDEAQQAQFIRLFKEQSLEAVILTSSIDNAFVSFLEYKNPGIKLLRIDADISDTLQQKKETEPGEAEKQADDYLNTQLETLFREVTGKEDLKVKAEELKTTQIPSMLLISEESRRMLEMKKAYEKNEEMKAFFANVKPDETLVLNKSNHLVELILNLREKEDKKADTALLCRQIYDLALMSQRNLTPEEMTTFLDRSVQIMEKLAESEEK